MYINDLTPEKPKIILDKSSVDYKVHDKLSDLDETTNALLNGKYIVVEDLFYLGLQVLEQVKKRILQGYDKNDFKQQREFRDRYREVSHRVLVNIKDHQIDLKKAPSIGWFKILYPDNSDFLISFPELQGLNSSWQWYLKGVKIDALKLKINPYYGVYFPTRFDHLKLFKSWLKKYKGYRENSIDIGFGSGVLSFLMLNDNFNTVVATDNNINAIIGGDIQAKKLRLDERLTLKYGDLFCDSDQQFELIVFNPPWLISENNLKGIDKAIYYNKGLFDRFFREAKKYLARDGKLVIIFSNFAEIVGNEDNHPIRNELERYDRFTKESIWVRDVKPSSKKTKRKDWRSKEKIELWVLVHK